MNYHQFTQDIATTRGPAPFATVLAEARSRRQAQQQAYEDGKRQRHADLLAEVKSKQMEGMRVSWDKHKPYIRQALAEGVTQVQIAAHLTEVEGMLITESKVNQAVKAMRERGEVA